MSVSGIPGAGASYAALNLSQVQSQDAADMQIRNAPATAMLDKSMDYMEDTMSTLLEGLDASLTGLGTKVDISV